MTAPASSPAAAADGGGQPVEDGRVGEETFAGDAILEEVQSAGRPQRLQADDQPARQAAGEAGGQPFQPGRPHGRGEDQLNLPGQGAVHQLNHGFHGRIGQTMHVLDGDEVGLAGGGQVGREVGGIAVEVAGREDHDRQAGLAFDDAGGQSGDEMRLADAGGAVQKERVDGAARLTAANAVGDALDGGQRRAVFRQRHPQGPRLHACPGSFRRWPLRHAFILAKTGPANKRNRGDGSIWKKRR